jgi:DNA-binding MarR family transcriptional regulator
MIWRCYSYDVRDRSNRAGPPRGARSSAFLLAQVGSHAAAKFAERLAPLGLNPPHAGIFGVLSAHGGMSQQALCTMLGILPSRLVVLVDDLEGRGFVERRDSPDDRRSYALHLTERGRQTLEAVGRVAREHDSAVCAALNEKEREQFHSWLARIADQQGLTPGVHPGFKRLGRDSDAKAGAAPVAKPRGK